MREYKSKFFISIILIGSIFLVFMLRLVYLQILKGDDYEKFSVQNRIRVIKEFAPRGSIFDRNGKPLVVDRASFNVKIFPKEISDPDAVSKLISSYLDESQQEIAKRIVEAREQNSFFPVTIARDIGRDALIAIETIKPMLSGVAIEVSYLRDYPGGKLGAFILGYLGKPTEEDLRTHPDTAFVSILGKTGIEKSREDILRGTSGIKYQTVDVMGREVQSNLFQVQFPNKEIISGSDVFLTVDSGLQKVAEETLSNSGKIGSVIVVDVNTGGILAMAASPSFTPDSFVGGIDFQKWNELVNDPSKPMLNRSTQGVYLPGSVFKIVTALAGLREKIITPETEFHCPGHYSFGEKKFRCWKHSGHGWVNMHSAMVQSCDVFFYTLGEKLGIDTLSEYARLFGFGQATGIEISEEDGLVPTRSWKNRVHKEIWYPGETIIASIGQGYLTVTPLQVAMMTAAVANGGVLLRPQIVRKVVSDEGERTRLFSPEVVNRLPFDDQELQHLQNSLVGAVNEIIGTGSRAIVGRNMVAGKTGTSQVVSRELQTDNPIHEDHAWFTSYYPARSPEIAVTVLIEHGGKGGRVAAPVARKVIEKYRQIRTTSGR